MKGSRLFLVTWFRINPLRSSQPCIGSQNPIQPIYRWRAPRSPLCSSASSLPPCILLPMANLGRSSITSSLKLIYAVGTTWLSMVSRVMRLIRFAFLSVSAAWQSLIKKAKWKYTYTCQSYATHWFDRRKWA